MEWHYRAANPFKHDIKNKFSFVTTYISYRCSGENLWKCQANSSFLIVSLILMTNLFYIVLILQGEIWWSLF